MTPETVLTIATQAVHVAFILTAVILVPALLVGLLVSMFQAATQLNEQTLSFIPKLLITFATLLVAGPWMLTLVIDYTKNTIDNIPMLIG
jgi:flagellar biosynthetic protein FliQ